MVGKSYLGVPAVASEMSRHLENLEIDKIDCRSMRKTHRRTLPICDFGIRVPANKLRFRDLRRKGLFETPLKLGEYLRNRRLILGLTQKQVANRLGILREVYDRWERDEREPIVSAWPKIIAFLGSYPGQPVTSPAHLVLMVRRITGLDQRALAQQVGVIPQQVRR